MDRSCPLCGRDNRSVGACHYSRPPWKLKRCSGCGFVYLENAADYSSLRDQMAWHKTYAAEAERRKLDNPVLYSASRASKALIQRLFKPDKLISWVHRYLVPGPVLDVGCADGHTLERLPLEFIPYGIEISSELSAIARQRFASRGGHVVNADAIHGLQQLAERFFTGVIMTGFLEHETNPQGVLLAAVRIMGAGTRLIIKVPNYACWNRAIRGKDWCGFRFPDHVNYFTPALLTDLLTHTGFRIVRFSIADHLPTSDNMWLVAEPR